MAGRIEYLSSQKLQTVERLSVNAENLANMIAVRIPYLRLIELSSETRCARKGHDVHAMRSSKIELEVSGGGGEAGRVCGKACWCFGAAAQTGAGIFS